MKITNFYQFSENIASGAQPTVEQIVELQQTGYDAVVNISPENTRNYLKNEDEIVENADMKYVHFPVDCSNLQENHYLTFKEILSQFQNSKIFVHCGGNIKSSNLIHMYNVLELNIDEKESLKMLLEIQNPEQKWFEYFIKFGMKGIQNIN